MNSKNILALSLTFLFMTSFCPLQDAASLLDSPKIPALNSQGNSTTLQIILCLVVGAAFTQALNYYNLLPSLLPWAISLKQAELENKLQAALSRPLSEVLAEERARVTSAASRAFDLKMEELTTQQIEAHAAAQAASLEEKNAKFQADAWRNRAEGCGQNAAKCAQMAEITKKQIIELNKQKEETLKQTTQELNAMEALLITRAKRNKDLGLSQEKADAANSLSPSK